MLGSLNKSLRRFFCPSYSSINTAVLEGGYIFALLDARRTDTLTSTDRPEFVKESFHRRMVRQADHERGWLHYLAVTAKNPFGRARTIDGR